ncbi:MAG: ankyrin repeat domain-containing protein [Spirochaetaceae bacterium]|nr:ankyrin repeat domain-containing protein [Spirochaetaceae bacterium]
MDMQTMLNEDLLTAIQRGNFDMVKSLISQGADVNYATIQGNSPLTYAVYSGDIEIIKFLLQKGADPNKKNRAIGGGENSAVTFARYIVKNERLATFLEYY